MIRTDEDALICDLAETYHIFDYRAELPCKKVALLAVGLRSTSRIKTKLAGFEQPFDIVLLASCLDRLKELVWFNTEDGQKGKNRPDSIADKFIIKGEPTEQGCSIEEFEAWRKNLTEG